MLSAYFVFRAHTLSSRNPAMQTTAIAVNGSPSGGNGPSASEGEGDSSDASSPGDDEERKQGGPRRASEQGGKAAPNVPHRDILSPTIHSASPSTYKVRPGSVRGKLRLWKDSGVEEGQEAVKASDNRAQRVDSLRGLGNKTREESHSSAYGSSVHALPDTGFEVELAPMTTGDHATQGSASGRSLPREGLASLHIPHATSDNDMGEDLDDDDGSPPPTTRFIHRADPMFESDHLPAASVLALADEDVSGSFLHRAVGGNTMMSPRLSNHPGLASHRGGPGLSGRKPGRDTQGGVGLGGARAHKRHLHSPVGLHPPASPSFLPVSAQPPPVPSEAASAPTTEGVPPTTATAATSATTTPKHRQTPSGSLVVRSSGRVGRRLSRFGEGERGLLARLEEQETASSSREPEDDAKK